MGPASLNGINPNAGIGVFNPNGQFANFPNLTTDLNLPNVLTPYALNLAQDLNGLMYLSTGNPYMRPLIENITNSQIPRNIFQGSSLSQFTGGGQQGGGFGGVTSPLTAPLGGGGGFAGGLNGFSNPVAQQFGQAVAGNSLPGTNQFNPATTLFNGNPQLPLVAALSTNSQGYFNGGVRTQQSFF
jgi:hypothetical protein